MINIDPTPLMAYRYLNVGKCNCSWSYRDEGGSQRGYCILLMYIILIILLQGHPLDICVSLTDSEYNRGQIHEDHPDRGQNN